MPVSSLGAGTCSGLRMLQNTFKSLFQEGRPLCSPEGRDCIATYSEETFGCQVPCEGLYADVSKFEVVENFQYNRIIEEYLSYKRKYVNKVRFNGSASSSFFSEYFCLVSLRNLFFLKARTFLIHPLSLSTSSLTRPPSTRSRETRRSSLRVSLA